jgi:hypothetical protein
MPRRKETGRKREGDEGGLDRLTALEGQVAELQRRIAQIEETLHFVGIRPAAESGVGPGPGEGLDFRSQMDQILLEMMKLHPDYEDVDEVLTQEAIDDAFAFMTDQYLAVDDAEGDPEEVERALRERVWSMPNPYRFLYELIVSGDLDDEEAPGGETEH